MILNLPEGRSRGDDIFDTMAATLFPSGNTLQSKIIMMNLSEHSSQYIEVQTDDLKAELKGIDMHTDDYENENHVSSGDLALLYFILCITLAEQSRGHGDRIRHIV